MKIFEIEKYLKKKFCSWCALSTDSYGNYITWAYCGYGNSNEDNCVFPFVYGGVEYSTCTDSWCATSAYENTKEYYSYKYCDADELALGLTTFDYGAGTTVGHSHQTSQFLIKIFRSLERSVFP